MLGKSCLVVSFGIARLAALNFTSFQHLVRISITFWSALSKDGS